MPRARAGSASTISVEPEKPVEFEEQVNLEGDNDMEETVEEEVEYEEVEEEVEEEEVEEEEEEEVEEEEVEEEEEEEVENNGDGISSQKGGDDEKMKGVETEEDVDKKHAELLALPPHGSEVYIGGFHQDVCEEDLRHFCESIGEVTEVRMMKAKDSNENKRYAFVTFRTEELASTAIEELNNAELKQGKKVKCSTSQAKHKLFIGNVPRNWGEEDLRKAVNKIGPGVTSVELVKDPHNSSRNRGFAFIGYYNHACAEYSRQKMSNQKFKLDDNAPTVSWADPRNAESSASLQVKAVYVRNLPKDITQDQLKNLFEHHGKITKVVLPPARKGQENRRIGFIHFAERSSTMKALKDTEKYELDGHVLECSLAKPQAEQKPSGGPNSQKTAILPSYAPPLGYGLVGAAYGALGAGYGAAGFGQPLMYGAGPTPAGLAMMPMLLPDGRVGYVLQQPGAQPHTPLPHQRGGRGGGGGRGSPSGGRRGSDSGRGRSRYNPY